MYNILFLLNAFWFISISKNISEDTSDDSNVWFWIYFLWGCLNVYAGFAV